MNTIMEKAEKKESRYLLSRDDSSIEFAVEKLEQDVNELNNLLRYMETFTEFPLQSLEDVKRCISQGPRLYIQEATIARTDRQKLKALYGFEIDHDKLLQTVPLAHIEQLPQAENLAEVLRGKTLQDFDFDKGTFVVGVDAVRRIRKLHTHYAGKKASELHRRVDILKAECDAIKKEFGFDPLVPEQYSAPNNPYMKLYRLVKNSVGITDACKK